MILDRMKEVFDSSGKSQSDIARMLCVTPQYISKLLKGDQEPSERVILATLKAFPDISESWLRTGTGMMISPLTDEEELEEWIGQLQLALVQQDRVAAIKKNLLLAMKRNFKSDQTWIDIANFIEEVARMCKEDSGSEE